MFKGNENKKWPTTKKTKKQRREPKKSSIEDTKRRISNAGRDWGQEEKGTAEDEMAGWHH